MVESAPRTTQMRHLFIISVAALAVCAQVSAQDVNLPPQSAGLRALLATHDSLQQSSLAFGFPAQLMSPDGEALKVLGQAASSGQSELRAATDLLSVYENVKCEADRAMLRPLLRDRLRMYSRMLDLDAQSAALPLGHMQAGNEKAALSLRDTLRDAKAKLDEVAASL